MSPSEAVDPHDPPPEGEPPGGGAPFWLLPALLAASAVLGVALGGLLGPRWSDPALAPWVGTLKLCGEIFLALLKALVVPLVVTSIVVAVARLGRLQRLGRVAFTAASYFLTTTLIAVLTGLVIVVSFAPGRGAAPPAGAAAALPAASLGSSLADIVRGMVPSNVFAAAAETNVLGLIVMSIAFGVALARMGRRAAPLLEVLDTANHALLALVRFAVWLAPIGVAGLVADRIGAAGGGARAWAEVAALGGYAACVVLGLAFHAMLTLPVLLFVLGRRDPARFAGGMSEALLVAASTASSAATLGVTLRCVIERNRVSERTADFVLPLGATVNMDGTALYEAVAVVFIAQASGVELGGTQLFVVLITATLAAIGAAAIPEAGLVTMVLVLGAVGLPAEGIGLILSIDWVLDRLRTAVNVWGDAVGAAVVERFTPEPSLGRAP